MRVRRVIGTPEGDRSPGRVPGRGRAWAGLGLATAVLAGGAALDASPGRPRRAETEIRAALARGPHQGECDRCHTEHGIGEIVYPRALIGPDDNTLCDGCHTVPWAGGSYGGRLPYVGSSHGVSPAMIWPGPSPPPRIEAGAYAKCVNCHDPHGVSDATGEVPFLALAREEALCLACHDGQPAGTDVGREVRKTYRHPVIDFTGRHAGAGESTASDFAGSPVNRRHAECADCHNPHVARSDGAAGAAGLDASRTTRGASRVLVLNGAAGAVPAYTLLAGSDTLTTPDSEYQLCFKCHSSWTVQPPGQTDLARVLNPANPSYHPVEAPGRDPAIRPGAFVPGWSATSLTRCGDCHGSDAGGVAGPHGSIHRFILKQPYAASPARRAMAPDEICFACHAYAVYADRESAESTRSQSRFNRPNAEMGHAEHVMEENIPCYACHATHGSTSLGHLIVTGRNPGIASYTETAGGGSCTPTCHERESYQVNYPR